MDIAKFYNLYISNSTQNDSCLLKDKEKNMFKISSCHPIPHENV